jgi:3-hydroxybutyryl-CoA dehydrogenase
MAETGTVAVLGCGLMGSGIAEISAKAGYETHVREVNDELAEKGLGRIRKSLDRAVDKGKLEAGARDDILGRITLTTRLADLGGAGIVIEAVTEDLDTKNGMYRELDGICGKDTIFASNTSSLTIASMAAATSRPDRFVGLHFFNPVPVMKLVEVVRSIATSREAFERAFEFARSLGKEPVEAKDTSGFIVNRLLVPYMLDAIRAHEEGVGTIDQIDVAMKAGANHPMGPLTLADFVGLDTLAAIADVMFDEYRERRFAAPPTLRKMVAAGMYGRKSGNGFYDYSGDKPVPSELGL